MVKETFPITFETLRSDFSFLRYRRWTCGDFPRGLLRPGSPVRYSPPGWNFFYRGPEKRERNLTFLQKKLILFNNGKNRFPQHSIDPGRDHPVDIPALFFSRSFRFSQTITKYPARFAALKFRRKGQDSLKSLRSHPESWFYNRRCKRLGQELCCCFAMERTCSLVSALMLSSF